MPVCVLFDSSCHLSPGPFFLVCSLALTHAVSTLQLPRIRTKTSLARWLDVGQKHGHKGAEGVFALGRRLAPGLQLQVWPSQSITRDISSPQTTMVSTFFLLCYLLRIGVAKCKPDQKKAAIACLLAFTEAASAHESDVLPELARNATDILQPIWRRVAPNLNQGHLLWSGSVACALWCLALGPSSLAKEWAPSLLTELAVRMEIFAIRCTAPAVQVVAARQQRGKKRSRRLSHVLRSHLNTKKRPRLETSEQDPDSQVTLDTNRNILQGHWLYLAQVAAAFKSAYCFELCLDSSRFGGREIELTLAYSADRPLDLELAPQSDSTYWGQG